MIISTTCMHCGIDLPSSLPSYHDAHVGVYGMEWDENLVILCEGDHCCDCFDMKHYQNKAWIRLRERETYKGGADDYFIDHPAPITLEDLIQRGLVRVSIIEEVPM